MATKARQKSKKRVLDRKTVNERIASVVTRKIPAGKLPDVPEAAPLAEVAEQVAGTHKRNTSGLRPGRQPGAKCRLQRAMGKAARKGLAAAIESTTSPLEVMLMRMRDPASVTDASFVAAVAAAPYVHPKRMAVAHLPVPAGDKLDLSRCTREEIETLERILDRGQAAARAVSPPTIEHQVAAAEAIAMDEEADAST